MASLIVSSLREPFIPSLIAIPTLTLSFHQSRAGSVINWTHGKLWHNGGKNSVEWLVA